MTNKTQSLGDIFSASRLPSALQNDIFLPNERSDGSNSYNGEHSPHRRMGNPNSDTDSLVDFEQWANDIRENGQDNAAFEYDLRERVQADVHTATSESISKQTITKTNYSKVRKQTDLDIDDHLSFASENEYDNPDLIYAKINKKISRNSSNSNVADRSDSPDMVNPYGSSSTIHSSNSRGARSTDDYSSNRLSTENRVDLRHNETATTSGIGGALYSKVRRLSGGSLTNLSSASLSVYSPHGSLSDPYIDMTTPSLIAQTDSLTVHDATTLELRRRPSVTFQDPVLDSESDSNREQSYSFETGQDGDSARQVSASTSQANISHTVGQNDYTAEEQALDSMMSHLDNQYDLADGADDDSNLDNNFINAESRHDQLDLNSLEERLHELKTRQESISMKETHTLYPKGILVQISSCIGFVLTNG